MFPIQSALSGDSFLPETVADRAARVNSRLSATARPFKLERSTKPCFSFFGRSKHCERGDECNFSHDVENYKAVHGLKECPSGCGNFFRETSNQCKECVTALYEYRNKERADRQAEFDAREETECQGHNCSSLTKFRLCKPCFDVNKHYTVNRGR